MKEEELVEALAAKNRELDELMIQRRFGPQNKVLREEALALERALAEKRGEAHVIEWPVGAAWNGMAYGPTIVGDGLSCAVVFATKTREHAVIRFQSIAGYKLTDVSDEIIQGHPLTGKGLIAYRTFLVKNSPWIKELEAIDKTHPQHIAERWRASQHYLLCFKDRMFEAIASDARLVGSFATSAEAIQRALKEILPAACATEG